METNAKIIFLGCIFLLSSCFKSAVQQKEINRSVPLDSSIKEILDSKSSTKCGKPYYDSLSLVNTIVRNTLYFDCLAEELSDQEYSNFMGKLTPRLPFNNKGYYNYFDHIEHLDDSLSFSNAIELLKIDFKPTINENSDVFYYDLYITAWDRLIYPKIAFVNGKSIDKLDLGPLYSTKEDLYYEIKELWVQNKIILKSEREKLYPLREETINKRWGSPTLEINNTTIVLAPFIQNMYEDSIFFLIANRSFGGDSLSTSFLSKYLEYYDFDYRILNYSTNEKALLKINENKRKFQNTEFRGKLIFNSFIQFTVKSKKVGNFLKPWLNMIDSFVYDSKKLDLLNQTQLWEYFTRVVKNYQEGSLTLKKIGEQ